MIRVWQRLNLEFVRVLRGHRGSVLALFSIGGLLLSGGRDNLIRVWDSETLVCRRTLVRNTSNMSQHTVVWLRQLHRSPLNCPCPRTFSPQAGHKDDVLSISGVGMPVAEPSLDMHELLSPRTLSALSSARCTHGDPVSSPAGTVGSVSAGATLCGLSPAAMSPPGDMIERAALFASSSADATVRLWSVLGVACRVPVSWPGCW